MPLLFEYNFVRFIVLAPQHAIQNDCDHTLALQQVYGSGFPTYMDQAIHIVGQIQYYNTYIIYILIYIYMVYINIYIYIYVFIYIYKNPATYEPKVFYSAEDLQVSLKK